MYYIEAYSNETGEFIETIARNLDYFDAVSMAASYEASHPDRNTVCEC